MTSRAMKKTGLSEKMKKASENPTPIKKINNKPQTERKRRERINKCLGQLKCLVFRATGKDEKKYPRLEKADILEMAVNHLYTMNAKDSKQGTEEADDRYREGYSHCIGEVLHCLRFERGIDVVTKTNLINHLTVSLSHLASTNQQTGYINQAFEVSVHDDSSSPSASGKPLHPNNVPSSEGVQEVPVSVQPKCAEAPYQDHNIYMDFYTAPLDVRRAELNPAYTERMPCDYQSPCSPFHSDFGVPLHTSTPMAKKRLRVIPDFPALEDINLSDCVATSSSSDSGSSAGPWRPW